MLLAALENEIAVTRLTPAKIRPWPVHFVRVIHSEAATTRLRTGVCITYMP
jgi:hypothetical protein